jgi:hypothetical protein
MVSRSGRIGELVTIELGKCNNQGRLPQRIIEYFSLQDDKKEAMTIRNLNYGL